MSDLPSPGVLLRNLANLTFAALVLPKIDAARWGIVALSPTVSVRGLVFGRRGVDKLGSVFVLALQPDGGFRPMVLPVLLPIVFLDECEVRRAYVLAHRPAHVPRGHALTPSPVDETVCVCGEEGSLYHDREAKRVAIEGVVGSLDVEVRFAEGAASVISVAVRKPAVDQPLLNPVPGVGSLVAYALGRAKHPVTALELAAQAAISEDLVIAEINALGEQVEILPGTVPPQYRVRRPKAKREYRELDPQELASLLARLGDAPSAAAAASAVAQDSAAGSV